MTWRSLFIWPHTWVFLSDEPTVYLSGLPIVPVSAAAAEGAGSGEAGDVAGMVRLSEGKELEHHDLERLERRLQTDVTVIAGQARYHLPTGHETLFHNGVGATLPTLPKRAQKTLPGWFDVHFITCESSTSVWSIVIASNTMPLNVAIVASECSIR